MPRPSLKDQRRSEILDAYLTCVSKFGLEGATQEKIAAETGIKRAMIRHNLGNKGDMIKALTDHLAAQFNAQTNAFESLGFKNQKAILLVDYLFSEESLVDSRLVLVFQALIHAAEKYPDVRQPLLGSVEYLVKFVSGILGHRFTAATKYEIEAISTGLVNLHLICDSLLPLNPPDRWRKQSRDAALSMLVTLGKEK
jgi:AcrR family transcriptional regulator